MISVKQEDESGHSSKTIPPMPAGLIADVGKASIESHCERSEAI
jgi:hypothetical protein